MPTQLRRAVVGVLAAALGGVGLAALGPALMLAGDSALCLSLSPAQSWVGLRLHLISESAMCAQGGYLGTDQLIPVLGFSVMVSVSALLAGLAIFALAISSGVTVRTLLRKLGAWLRRRWLYQVSVSLPTPQLVPVEVRGRGHRAELAHQPSQRRGPPRYSC
jgi:hypothetical protein